MQTVPVVVHQQPAVVVSPPRTVAVKETRVLGIFQIIIGAFTLILGIVVVTALDPYFAGYVGFGIWGGIWIIVGGVLGICSALYPTNYCLNGTNMAFAILSCMASFMNFIVYCVAITYYRGGYCTNIYYPYYGYNCSIRDGATGTALYSLLLVAMIAEFAISLSVSIYCCKFGCNCCDNSSTGVIIQQAQPTTFVQSSGITYSTQPMVYSIQGTTGPVYSSYPNQQMQPMTYTTTAPSTGYAQPANPHAMTYGHPGIQPANMNKAFAPEAPPAYSH